jgi:hypothetical protein
VASLFAQEAFVRAVTHTCLRVRLGSTDGVMVGSGVVAPTSDATNSSARDSAGLGVFVVAKLVAPATLDEVGCYVTVGTFTRRGLSSTAALALKSRGVLSSRLSRRSAT